MNRSGDSVCLSVCLSLIIKGEQKTTTTKHRVIFVFHGSAFRNHIHIPKPVSHTSQTEVMCLITFLGAQLTGENNLGTGFSACKTGKDPLNATFVKQSLFLLLESLLQPKNSSVLLNCLWFRCTPCAKVCETELVFFGKVKIVCDIHSV